MSIINDFCSMIQSSSLFSLRFFHVKSKSKQKAKETKQSAVSRLTLRHNVRHVMLKTTSSMTPRHA